MRLFRSTRSEHQSAPPSVGSMARRRVGRSRVPLHRRLLTARVALAYWAVVLLLAFVTATSVARLMERAKAAERRFGPVRQVLVARSSLRPGQRVTADDTVLQERPVAQLPTGALERVPPDGTVSGPVARGEVLTTARLRSDETDQPAGTAAIAVPLGEARLPVRVGDHVDVYATYDAALAPRDTEPTSRVAIRAEVRTAGRESITVLVRNADAPGLAGAVARATVTVARVR